MLPSILFATAAGAVLAVVVVALWHRSRVTAAWRRRLAVVTTDARRLRRAEVITGDGGTAADICTSVLRLAEERAALGMLPSLSRRRHEARVAVERAADDLVWRLSRLADTADAGRQRPAS